MLLAGLMSLAMSQVGAATPAVQANAKAYYQSGMAAYGAGQFLRAVDEFKAADALNPSANLSFDIAEAYEKAADLLHARRYYEQYLQRAPQAPDRFKVQSELTSIDAQLAQAAASVAMSTPPLIVTEVAPAPRPNRTFGVALMSLGAIGLAAGIGLNLVSSGDAHSLTGAAHPQAGPTAQHLYDQSNSLWTGAIVGYAVGGAVLTSGALLFLVQSLSHPDVLATDDVAGGVNQ